MKPSARGEVGGQAGGAVSKARSGSVGGLVWNEACDRTFTANRRAGARGAKQACRIDLSELGGVSGTAKESIAYSALAGGGGPAQPGKGTIGKHRSETENSSEVKYSRRRSCALPVFHHSVQPRAVDAIEGQGQIGGPGGQIRHPEASREIQGQGQSQIGALPAFREVWSAGEISSLTSDSGRAGVSMLSVMDLSCLLTGSKSKGKAKDSSGGQSTKKRPPTRRKAEDTGDTSSPERGPTEIPKAKRSRPDPGSSSKNPTEAGSLSDPLTLTTAAERRSGSQEGDDSRPFFCTRCLSGFSSKSNLQVHSKTVHEGERPFGCSQCSHRFGTKSNRNRHEKMVHRNERSYNCPHCNKPFGTKSCVRRHCAKIHGTSDSPR